MTPIYQTSTYVQEGVGRHKGYEYSRSQNPTRTALEQALAAAENARHGLCFSSGMAAIDAVMRLLNPGDEVLASSDLYGGSYRLFTKVCARYGLQFRFEDLSDTASVARWLGPATRLIWVETPSNPLMRITDIAALATLARERGLMLAVDNTFASPFLQNPLDLGAQLAVHSATKYLGGHSDVVHGAVLTSDDGLEAALRFVQNSCGAVPGPQDCFLVLRGLKTLHVRMRQHCENARQIAWFLRSHPRVDRVYWCGFEDHPNHGVACRQMRDFGGMMSFSLKEDSLEAAGRVLASTKLFSLAESLGGVESLIGHPATMTHASIPREERLKNGLSDSLIRLSVGIEDAEDLIDDLQQALG